MLLGKFTECWSLYNQDVEESHGISLEGRKYPQGGGDAYLKDEADIHYCGAKSGLTKRTAPPKS